MSKLPVHDLLRGSKQIKMTYNAVPYYPSGVPIPTRLQYYTLFLSRSAPKAIVNPTRREYIKGMVSVTQLPHVGKKRAQLLKKIGIQSVSDLLYHFPRRYEDRRQYGTLSQITDDTPQPLLVMATITRIERVQTKTLTFPKIYFTDGNEEGVLVCFNRQFYEHAFETGSRYAVYGTFSYAYNEKQATLFEFCPETNLADSPDFERLIPIYPLTEGLNQKMMRQFMKAAFPYVETVLHESLPESIRTQYQFPSLEKAIQGIHFPNDEEEIQESQRRFKYQEAYKMMIPLANRNLALKQNHAAPCTIDGNLTKQFLQDLPFELTPGQQHAWNEIEADLHEQTPMTRLLQGDVGCGKTIIALLAILTVVESGNQAALMVPTEVLAHQHYETLMIYLAPFVSGIRLLHGSITKSERDEVYKGLHEGTIQVVVGTQSIFNPSLEYQSLNLVIIDEQHKFGVRERLQLVQKGNAPHVLVMSATPIPQTLALTYYGDLACTTIPDKPATRLPIKTKVRFERDRQHVWNQVSEELHDGNVGFIIYPVIDESEQLQITSINKEIESVRAYFGSEQVGVIHGRMNTEEKRTMMDRFFLKEITVLVATTVVEVGIDIPEATFMIVESAERFGLAQLHQLRGRIGRGNKPARCYLLVSEDITEEGKERMRAMVQTDDGFKLAEIDLRLRGPGEILGLRQAGFPEFKLIDFISDGDLLQHARQDAYHHTKASMKLIQEGNQL